MNVLELASQRATAERTMSSTMRIVQRAIASDGMGGRTGSETVIAKDIPCRLSHAQGQDEEVVRAGRVTEIATHSLLYPWDETVLRPRHIVEIDGRRYECITRYDAAPYRTHNRAHLRELNDQ